MSYYLYYVCYSVIYGLMGSWRASGYPWGTRKSKKAGIQPFQGLSRETRSSLPRKPRAIPLYRTKMLYTIFVQRGWMI